MKKDVLFLKPYISETIWGGKKLEEYGYECPYEKNAEAWLVSAIENKCSLITNENNMTLLDYYNQNRDFFNNFKGDYPLLVKIIDANDDLSIQVHPDNKYAKEKHNKFGKWESWYVLNCKNNGNIVYGHKAKNKNELVSLIENKKWKDLIIEREIKRGDIIDVPPGTIHAIKSSTLIFELQQSSDVTYRLYDYERLSKDGKPRELHLSDSINMIYYPQDNLKISNNTNNNEILSNPFYKLYKIINDGEQKYCFKNAHWIQATVIDGVGKLNEYDIKKGTTFLVKHNKEFILKGSLTVLISFVPKN